MKPLSYHFIPLTILFISSFTITTSQNLINSTCLYISQSDPNIKYGFCTTSLQASPAKQCTTLQALGATTIDLISHNITDTIGYTKQLLTQNKKWDSYTEQCLRDCLDLYSDAMSDAEDAMRYYDVKKFDDANVRISSIMDASTTCEDGFRERRGINVVSPLTKRNDDVFQLSAISLSVMHMIQVGSG